MIGLIGEIASECRCDYGNKFPFQTGRGWKLDERGRYEVEESFGIAL